MVWYNEFNSVFWLTVATIVTGSIGLGLKFCLKSKCENFTCCWGMVNIDRNVQIEADEEIRAMELGTKQRSENNLSNTGDNTNI